jgi:hypothetical protein
VSIAVIAKLLAAGLLTWFALLLALIVVRALSNQIEVKGMLTHSDPSGPAQPERVLNMAVFPVVLMYFVLEALRADMSVRASLPDIPEVLLVALTGSNSLYLAGKMARKPAGDGGTS